MLDERAEATPGPDEKPYEPPAMVTVGSTVDMTAGDDSSSLTFDSPPQSDRLLKWNVTTVDRPLERLRAIRIR